MLRYLGILTTVVALALLSACGTGSSKGSQGASDLAPAFLTPVAAAHDAGVTVFWLGHSFVVDGVLFTASEAKFPEGIQGVLVDGLEINYSPGPQPGGRLDLDVFPKSAWVAVEEKVRNPRVPDVTKRAVSVGSRQGELLFLPFGTRPINALWLILQLGEVVIVAEALAGGPVHPGGPDSNPFINNPDLLVALMEDLRPYPD